MSEHRPVDENRVLGPKSKQKSHLLGIWVSISQVGLAEVALRIGTHVLLLVVILPLAWGLRAFYYLASEPVLPGNVAIYSDAQPTETPGVFSPDLPIFEEGRLFTSGVSREAHIHTDIPSRPRTQIIKYIVQPGDTLLGIAEKYRLQPETVLWANQSILGDNPHNLQPGQELDILPVDGTVHRWSVGDGMIGVADFFDASPEDIINYPGNKLDSETLGDWSNPNIQPGTWLVIPGGRREFVSWTAPDIPRDDPGVGKILGAGACETIVEGAIGSGVFVWPADARSISGYDYYPNANHLGIDIEGEEGQPVYTADSGVVVYSGWNDWGYGYLIVVNHGNGWQTLYAHLGAIFVSCGQSVWQGDVIAAIGASGNASGSHLHFEMMFEGENVNPHDYLR
jgi:murein DD-endopeptidase MepM/ murein hydrolase activator NlpD